MPTHQASKALAGEIRARLARAGQTQIELSAASGIPISKLRRRLSGEAKFSVDELAAIADALGVHSAELIPGRFA